MVETMLSETQTWFGPEKNQTRHSARTVKDVVISAEGKRARKRKISTLHETADCFVPKQIRFHIFVLNTLTAV